MFDVYITEIIGSTCIFSGFFFVIYAMTYCRTKYEVSAFCFAFFFKYSFAMSLIYQFSLFLTFFHDINVL